MFDLILIGYFSYRNGVRAKLKGQNIIAWGALTALSYIVFMLVGFFVVVINFCNNINLSQLSSIDKAGREAVTQQILQAFEANPLHPVTLEIFGIGGYLLIRYILDRKPNKKEPEIHWMDKMGK